MPPDESMSAKALASAAVIPLAAALDRIGQDDGAPVDPTPVERAIAREPTESNLAIAFVSRYRDKLLYCHERGCWLEWTGTHWREETRLRAYHYCVALARLVPGGKAIAKASFAKGVETIARAEPAVSRVASDFDRDRLLLATPGGTVELATGTLRAARQDDLITRCTSVAPNNGEPVQWHGFLDQVLEGDAERAEFLQDFLGYSLTGATGAEIFAYLAGPGGNGKSTLLKAMLGILGDYGWHAPLSLLLYSPLPVHSTSTASLEGRRFVVASELPPGARLDEQKLKGITGGDPVTARKVNRDDRTFTPELKLLIAANHHPRIVRPDEAMRRRLRVITMPNVIANPDPHFKNAILPQEYGQILAWLMVGAQRVLARGERFTLPAKVREDSEAYLGSQDSIGSWIGERCEPHGNAREARSRLYRDFEQWAQANGEYVLPAREFYQELRQRGMREQGLHGERQLVGLRLLPAPASTSWWADRQESPLGSS